MNRKTIQETVGIILAELNEKGGELINSTQLNFDLKAEDFADEVRYLLDNCRNIINEVSEEVLEVMGIDLPDYLCNFKYYINSETEKMSTIKLSVRTKKVAIPATKLEVPVTVDDSFVENVVNTVFTGYKDVIFSKFISDNLNEINEFLAGVLAEEEIPYTVAFTIDGTNRTFTSLTDTGIIFNLTFEEGLNLGNCTVLNVLDEYDEYTKNLAKDRFIKEIKKIHTSLQLVKAPITLINDICHNKSRRKVESIVKESCDRDIFKLRKDGIGYYFKETEDIRVIAIVELKDDDYTVLLSPTDIKTMTKVDFDVVTEIKEYIKELEKAESKASKKEPVTTTKKSAKAK